jgi:hypothetical protein
MRKLLNEEFEIGGGELQAEEVVAFFAVFFARDQVQQQAQHNNNQSPSPPAPAPAEAALESAVEELSSWGVLYALDVPALVDSALALIAADVAAVASNEASSTAPSSPSASSSFYSASESTSAAGAAAAAKTGEAAVGEAAGAETVLAGTNGRVRALQLLAEALEDDGGQLEPDVLVALFRTIHDQVIPLMGLAGAGGEDATDAKAAAEEAAVAAEEAAAAAEAEAGSGGGAVAAGGVTKGGEGLTRCDGPLFPQKGLEKAVAAVESWGGVHAIDARDLLLEALGEKNI